MTSETKTIFDKDVEMEKEQSFYKKTNHAVFFILGDSAAFEVYVLTVRNSLSVPSS